MPDHPPLRTLINLVEAAQAGTLAEAARRYGVETLYRGESVYNRGGGFFTPERQFALQFTHSGRDSEIMVRYMCRRDIFDAGTTPLPYAGNEAAFDSTLATAQAGGFKAMWLSEGHDQPPSVYVFDKTGLFRSKIAAESAADRRDMEDDQ